MHLPSLLLGRLERASDNLKGLLPDLIRIAGFHNVEETARYMTAFGTIALYRAQKPKTTSRKATNEEKEEANITVKDRKRGMTDDEEKYYSLLRKYARALAPFYDSVTAFMSRLRDSVANSADAKTGSRILDVATGTGKQAFAFAKRGYDVVGIDLSEDMLEVAKKSNRYENARFEVADAMNLPFEDNSFDVSSVSFALHDMIPTVREKALKEMVRTTKPKGTIIIVDYALPENKIRRFLFYNIVRLYEPYYTEFIKSDLKTLLKKSGIQIEEELTVLHGVGRVIKGKRVKNADA
jgi:demethylmenaquinone methyltransferase/2-methoxy-6-polyprenyl-1,4-benzoquinol methylase